MRRFLFALVCGGSLAACSLYFDDSNQPSRGGPTRPDAPQQPYPDGAPYDGGAYPDAPDYPDGAPYDGGWYPDAPDHPDAPCGPDGGPGYPDAALDAY